MTRVPGESVATNTALLTDDRRNQFLERVGHGESIGKAARAVGTRRHYVKKLIAEDEAFAALYDEAQGHRRDLIRDEIHRRAFDPDDPASAKLLVVLAQAVVPEFRPKANLEVEHGGTVEVTVEHDYGRLLDKLEHVGLIRRGPATDPDAPPLALLPARAD